jgi:biotin transporter BioY
MANSGNGRARLENILAAMAVGLLAISVLSIIGLMLLSKLIDTSYFILIPYIGLPTSALLIIVLLVLQIRKKSGSN